MMATTHALASLAVALLAVRYLPGQVPPSLVIGAAVAGGLAPDLDLVAEHRKTLHYPTGYALLAACLGAITVATGSPAAALATVVLGAATLHAVSEIGCGSPEREPWNPSVDRAVYDHVLGGWHRPRRYVRYSGAPEDWLLGAAFGLVAIASPVTSARFDAVLLGVLLASAAYCLLRKRLELVARSLSAVTPGPVASAVPNLVVVEHEGGGSTVRLRFGE